MHKISTFSNCWRKPMKFPLENVLINREEREPIYWVWAKEYLPYCCENIWTTGVKSCTSFNFLEILPSFRCNLHLVFKTVRTRKKGLSCPTAKVKKSLFAIKPAFWTFNKHSSGSHSALYLKLVRFSCVKGSCPPCPASRMAKDPRRRI